MAGMKYTPAGPPERSTRPPGPNTKGGGFRGGPKRWTGNGPAPARHIPWPEIFRHHISVVEGHMRMVDMVRKHTAEGSGNWKMICELLDRCREMLSMTKYVSRTFIVPPNHRNKVPLGSSSASMYPGYSPADHEYGKAAEEYGKWASETIKQGAKPELPGGLEYEIGQARGIKRGSLTGIREAKKQRKGAGSGSGSESDNAPNKKEPEPSAAAPTTNGDINPRITNPEEAEQGKNPYFVVDTEPMKLNIPGVRPPKRDTTPPDSSEKKHKKAKKVHDGTLPAGEGFEDISKEVDAKLKEKEEKKKHKEKKKRKRESSGGAPKTEPSTAPETSSKKKKAKLDPTPTTTESATDKATQKESSNEEEGINQQGDEKVPKQDNATIKRPSPENQSSEINTEAVSPKPKKQKLGHEVQLESSVTKKRKGEDGGQEGAEKKKKKKKSKTEESEK